MNGPQDQSPNPWAPPSPAGGQAVPPVVADPVPVKPTLPTAPPRSAVTAGQPVPPSPPLPQGPPVMEFGTPTRVPGPDPISPMVTVNGGAPGFEGGAVDGHRRSKGALVGAVLGVTALVAAGAFAVVKITGNDAEGGAASPAEVGTSLTSALDNEDFLGVIDLLLPGEREAFREPMIDLVGHLSRLEILSDDADLSKVGGIDIQFADVTVREESTNVADISNIYLSGSSTITVDGDKVPLGDLVIDELFDGERPDMDAEPENSEFDDTKMTVVERDGRWYLSALYSAAEAGRDGSDDIPESGVEAKGASTPEGAVQQMIDAVSDLDLEVIIATLDPSEAEALQRYAPVFLNEAQAQLDDVGLDWAITDTTFTVSGDGSRRSVAIDTLVFDATVPDIGTVRAELKDGCLKATAEFDGEIQEFSACRGDAAGSVFGGFGFGDDGFGDDAAGQKMFDVAEEAFADYEGAGISVHEVDGEWYVSPLRSGFDAYNGLLGALDADELRDIIAAARDFTESLDGNILDGGDGFELPDELPIELPIDDGTATGSTVATEDDAEFDAYSTCVQEVDAAAGVACLNAGVVAGTIDPLFVSPQFRFPECGVAEAYWDSEVYSLPDAEFIALVEAASPCFLDLVATGQLEAWEVPTELVAPQCLEGKNWYATNEEDYNTRVFDCAAAVTSAL